MFGWLKRKPLATSSGEFIGTQPPGEIFPWPEGTILTAVDELVLALPMALFDKDRPIGEIVFGPDDMQISIPPKGDVFFIRLMPGMSVSLAKSCQSYVFAEDKKPRRIKVCQPPDNA